MGTAAVITGSILAVRPSQLDPADPTLLISYRPVGTAVVTIGVGLVVTSVLMAIAAARASRQHRNLRLSASLP